MTWIAGVDGCSGGWAVALRNVHTGEMKLRYAGDLCDVVEAPERPEVIGVDIPIGLLEEARPGGRLCDEAARAHLGDLRGRSVFSPPVRAALDAVTYEEADRRNRASSPLGIGLSRHCFGIVPKIRAVDQWITPRRQKWIREVHPELSLAALNGGQALTVSKKTSDGLALRIRLLAGAWGRNVESRVASVHEGPIAKDDVVDALAACWTAERMLAGSARPISTPTVVDARGLRMEIVV